MPYLLSLLAVEPPTEETAQILCYYVNDTCYVQIIRAMNGIRCDFERIIFSQERIIFAALPASYLEVTSFPINRMRSRKINCVSLHINLETQACKTS